MYPIDHLRLLTEVVEVEEKLVLAIHIPEGLNKPYCTNKGVYLAKSGADKRKISQEELLRLFQHSKKLYSEEMELAETGVEDVDLSLFKTFYEKRWNNLRCLSIALIFQEKPDNFR